MHLSLPDVVSSLFVVTLVAAAPASLSLTVTEISFLFFLILFYIFFFFQSFFFFLTDLKFKLNVLTPELYMSESSGEIISQMTAFILEIVIYSYTESKKLFAHFIIVLSIVFTSCF